MKAIWLGLGSLVSLVGLLLVVLCLWFKDMDLVSEAITLIVAGLGFLAAVVGLTTWVEERQRVREDKARQVYEALMESLMAHFIGAPHSTDLEAILRSRVVVWGSAEVVVALQKWHGALDRVLAGTNGQKHLSPHEQEQVKQALGQVASAIREELGASAVDPKILLGALFNER